jgi:hypothetical protein
MPLRFIGESHGTADREACEKLAALAGDGESVFLAELHPVVATHLEKNTPLYFLRSLVAKPEFRTKIMYADVRYDGEFMFTHDMYTGSYDGKLIPFTPEEQAAMKAIQAQMNTTKASKNTVSMSEYMRTYRSIYIKQELLEMERTERYEALITACMKSFEANVRSREDFVEFYMYYFTKQNRPKWLRDYGGFPEQETFRVADAIARSTHADKILRFVRHYYENMPFEDFFLESPQDTNSQTSALTRASSHNSNAIAKIDQQQLSRQDIINLADALYMDAFVATVALERPDIPYYYIAGQIHGTTTDLLLRYCTNDIPLPDLKHISKEWLADDTRAYDRSIEDRDLGSMERQTAGSLKAFYKGFYYRVRKEGRSYVINTKNEGTVRLSDVKKWQKSCVKKTN